MACVIIDRTPSFRTQTGMRARIQSAPRTVYKRGIFSASGSCRDPLLVGNEAVGACAELEVGELCQCWHPARARQAHTPLARHAQPTYSCAPMQDAQTTAMSGDDDSNEQPFTLSLIDETTVDVALHPFDTLKTLLQADGSFWKAGGFKSVYNGVVTAPGAVPGSVMFFKFQVSSFITGP